ncbi:hypothetical protein J6590_067321 [Homalodisca vitripennis]|nr:hypothetical protein J6590_067321 [Homalodisca vitripennis]
MNPIRKSGLVARSLLGGDFNPLVVKPLVQGRNNNVTHKEECQEMKKGLPNASTETTKIGYGQVYDATPCNFHMQHKEGTYDDEINSYSSSDALNFEAGGSQGLQKV